MSLVIFSLVIVSFSCIQLIFGHIHSQLAKQSGLCISPPHFIYNDHCLVENQGTMGYMKHLTINAIIATYNHIYNHAAEKY